MSCLSESISSFRLLPIYVSVLSTLLAGAPIPVIGQSQAESNPTPGSSPASDPVSEPTPASGSASSPASGSASSPILSPIVRPMGTLSVTLSSPGAKRVKKHDKDAPVSVQAENIEGRASTEIRLEGNAEFIKDQTKVTAGKVTYRQIDEDIEASDQVKIQRFGDFYTGDELKLNLETGKGLMLNPTYKLELNNAQGVAKRVDFISDTQAVIKEGTYSTCEGPDPDWYLKVDTLNLDSGRDVGNAGKTIVIFKGVPILGTPAMSFALTGARVSGLLPPTLGATSTGGAEFTLPYYFNIAPNRDLTLFPKVIARRGLQLGANGRYLGDTYQGETTIEYIPQDRKASQSRGAVSSVHRQSLSDSLSASFNLNYASDDNYPTDFANSLATSTRRQLLREVRTDYVTPFLSAGFRVQNYQILQDPAALTDPTLLVERPYDRLPQLTLHTGKRYVSGLDWSADAELTRFFHPDKVRSVRLILNPQVSYSFLQSGFFVTPKVSLHASRYQLDGTAAQRVGFDDSISRTLPTFSIDSGLVFDRETSLLGRDVTQTLEPRLFYVNTPFRDQSRIPLFDTAETSFNFTQLFAENRFTGQDRISDNNQLTFGLTSRFIESSGVERLRLAFGQRYSFRDQRVLLNANSMIQSENRSDLLLSASGRITQTLSIDSAVQYNVSSSSTISSNFGAQWKPAEKSVLNGEYRYLRNSFEQVNISGQWPLTQRFYGVGRISYSVNQRRNTENLIGLEYNAECWVLRMVAQRFATTTQGATTSLFFQLELNGLSKLGNNPLEALSKSIPGYQKVNEPATGRQP